MRLPKQAAGRIRNIPAQVLYTPAANPAWRKAAVEAASFVLAAIAYAIANKA